MHFRQGAARTALILSALLLTAQPIAAQERQVSSEGLVYDLQHPDADRRKAAARYLGENKVRSAVPALIDATKDRNDEVRFEALKALVKINDTRALQAYIDATSDSKRNIREKAIDGLIDMYVVEESGFVQGVTDAVNVVNPLADDFDPRMVEPYVPVSQKAIEALAKLLKDDNTQIRAKAALALGILRAHSVLPDIQEALTRENKNEVKVELIRASYKIGDPSVGTYLIPFLDSNNNKVRNEAIFTLGRLRVRDAVQELMGFLDVQERRKVLRVVPVSGKDDLQKRALEALAYIGDPSTKGLFINSLADPRTDFRRYGAEGLARIGEGNVRDDLARSYLREEDGHAKLAMGFALYKLGREEHLIDLVQSLKGSDQGYLYLLEMQPAETANLFPYLESESNSKIRRRLIDVIGIRGDRSALPKLQDIAQNTKDSDILAAANMAIRRIQGRLGA